VDQRELAERSLGTGGKLVGPHAVTVRDQHHARVLQGGAVHVGHTEGVNRRSWYLPQCCRGRPELERA
jgi:hypothetical protein